MNELLMALGPPYLRIPSVRESFVTKEEMSHLGSWHPADQWILLVLAWGAVVLPPPR